MLTRSIKDRIHDGRAGSVRGAATNITWGGPARRWLNLDVVALKIVATRLNENVLT